MSGSVNKVILMGYAGNDPDVRTFGSGDKVANLSLATSERWRDKQTGEKREKTEWHRVAVFGKVAEVVERYVVKGTHLYVEGQLQTRKWQDQGGNDRYSTEVVVRGFGGTVQLIGGKGGAKQGEGSPAKSDPARQGPADLDDEIPF